MTEVNIIIADDHPMIAAGLRALLSAAEGFKISRSVGSGRELLEALEDDRPDLIILDISMPGMDGIETAGIVRKKYPSQKILCISSFYEDRLYKALKKIPVEGFAPKLADATIIIDCIRSILHGETVFIKHVDENTFTNRLVLTEISGKLSKREIAIMKLIRDNKSNKEIAAILNISVNTVETHRKNMCRKLNVNSHNGLYNFALEHF